MNVIRRMYARSSGILCCCAVLVLVLRLLQLLLWQELAGASSYEAAERYLYFNGCNIFAFVLVPLYLLGSTRALHLVNRPFYLLRSGGIVRASVRCLCYACVLGAAASVVTVTSGCAAVWASGPSEPDWSGLACSVLLGGYVYAIALLAGIGVELLSGSSSMAYLVVLFYGLWDFMAQNVVGGGVPSIAWGLANGSSWAGTMNMAFCLSYYSCWLAGLFLIVLLAFWRIEYVPKQA